jgi:ABC-type nickel/cobalt efflux system permease component RcnA
MAGMMTTTKEHTHRQSDKLSCYEHTKTSIASYLTIQKHNITCESLIISFFITIIKLTIVDNVLLLIKLKKKDKKTNNDLHNTTQDTKY